MKKYEFDQSVLSISHHAYAEEQGCVESLLPKTEIFSKRAAEIQTRAERYVVNLRENSQNIGIENFLQQYGLGTNEGVTIMCLAEALLRIPDSKTANELIHDKLSSADWDQHLGKSKSLFVNASTWGMMLTGKITSMGAGVRDVPTGGAGNVIGKLISRLGEPIIREALKHAMHVISNQFVLGQTIPEAVKNSQDSMDKGYLFSYDMLGEGARSAAQAQVYYQSYLNAIKYIGDHADKTKHFLERPSISVKLSALHPRLTLLHHDRVEEELLPRLKVIISKAMEAGIPISIDAEESYRTDSTLLLFQLLLADKSFQDYDGIGFVLQAYQKRAYHTLEHLIELGSTFGKRIPVRLVKGAYWDGEIKRAQEIGAPSYPVFTRKSHTDVSYLACAGLILANHDRLYPQFATHNALTVASILEVAGNKKIEFQRLFGMGENFYDQIVDKVPCRIYAPVGDHESLLPYLIRRLLENGANTSFVNLLLDKQQPINMILADPITKAIRNDGYSNPATPMPPDLYPDRKNSQGYDLGNAEHLEMLQETLEHHMATTWTAVPIIKGEDRELRSHGTYAPYDNNEKVGDVAFATHKNILDAITAAHAAYPEWSALPVASRYHICERLAELIEEHYYEAIALCMREAGKTLGDAMAEVRETLDYCYYYSMLARKHFELPQTLLGPTGELNTLSLHGRGVFMCISPWNFPMAIFTGQIVAALLAGNAVIAKPAQQTSLIGAFIIKLMHDAGVPADVLHYLPGQGEKFGTVLGDDARIAGVAFTGSTATARTINQALATREGPIVPLIAETGGINSMIVDSSALPEQAVDDIILSAFGSAGQRCSSLRVLFVQEDIADPLLSLLGGAMQELKIGSPLDFSTDVGPVIDATAKKELLAYIDGMKERHTLIASTPLAEDIDQQGHFVAPHAFEISALSEVKEEVFGPVLHVVRYQAKNLEQVIHDINSTGYGLTFGIHSRIEQRINYIKSRIRAGNVYVNRSMIGAVVGVQPFGGEGLSGTGPKAGGPNYLQRFASERSVSINTTAIGGNISLLS